MTARRIPGLDALRGVAALLVLGYHVGGLFLPRVLMGHGYLAVDLFFVISGVVLARAYDDRLRASEGLEFLRRRVKRLYPMALLGLVLGAGLWLASGERPGAVGALLARGALFLPVTTGRDVFPLNGPQWSLMWELAANLAYALIAPWLTTRRLTLLVVAGGLVHAALALIHGTGSLGPQGQDWWIGAPRVTFGFFAGVLLARLAAEGRLKVSAVPIGLILAAVVALLSWSPPETLRASFDLILALGILPWLVASAIDAKAARSQPLLDGLAGISYPLYALHIPILLAVDHAAQGQPWRWAADLLAVPPILAMAWAAHRWFEPWAASLFSKKPRKSEDQGLSTSAPSSSTR